MKDLLISPCQETSTRIYRVLDIQNDIRSEKLSVFKRANDKESAGSAPRPQTRKRPRYSSGNGAQPPNQARDASDSPPRQRQATGGARTLQRQGSEEITSRYRPDVPNRQDAVDFSSAWSQLGKSQRAASGRASPSGLVAGMQRMQLSQRPPAAPSAQSSLARQMQDMTMMRGEFAAGARSRRQADRGGEHDPSRGSQRMQIDSEASPQSPRNTFSVGLQLPGQNRQQAGQAGTPQSDQQVHLAKRAGEDQSGQDERLQAAQEKLRAFRRPGGTQMLDSTAAKALAGSQKPGRGPKKTIQKNAPKSLFAGRPSLKFQQARAANQEIMGGALQGTSSAAAGSSSAAGTSSAAARQANGHQGQYARPGWERDPIDGTSIPPRPIPQEGMYVDANGRPVKRTDTPAPPSKKAPMIIPASDGYLLEKKPRQ